MFSDIYMIILCKFTPENDIKDLLLTTCFLDDLSGKIALDIKMLIELLSSFIFHMKLSKETTIKHVT